MGANYDHGLRRTPADKRKAVTTLLSNPDVANDPQTGEPWSDREAARRCNVTHPFVAKIRASLTGNVSSDESPPSLTPEQQSRIDEIQYQLSEGGVTRDDANEQLAEIDPDWHRRSSGKRTYTNKHGTTSTMDTSKIGKKKCTPARARRPHLRPASGRQHHPFPITQSS